MEVNTPQPDGIIAPVATWVEIDPHGFSQSIPQSNFTRLATRINVEPLLESIHAQPDLWDEITARQTTPGSPHKYTRSIFLRWAQAQTLDAVFNELQAVDYPAMDRLPEARPLISLVRGLVGAQELGRVLIVSLEPGGYIEPHSDEGSYADYYERFHLCLESEPGNLFCTETEPNRGEWVHMMPGELWNFNHKAVHTLFNHSKSPRLHMIIDCVAPLFRRERA